MNTFTFYTLPWGTPHITLRLVGLEGLAGRRCRSDASVTATTVVTAGRCTKRDDMKSTRRAREPQGRPRHKVHDAGRLCPVHTQADGPRDRQTLIYKHSHLHVTAHRHYTPLRVWELCGTQLLHKGRI